MRLYAVVLCLTLTVCRPVGALPPVPPRVDYPLIDTFEYPEDRPAQAVWEPMGETAPVAMRTVRRRRVLEMPCNFDGTQFERVSWDRKGPVDMASCRALRFQFYCADVGPIFSFKVYFHSGKGWYVSSFAPEKQGAWNTITIEKAKTGMEGKPGGWGNVDAIRISAFRGSNMNTALYLADLGLVSAEPPVMILRNESVAFSDKERVEGVTSLSGQVAKGLESLGLPYTVMSDLDVTAERLAGKLVVLPYTPALPDAACEAMTAFLKGGGKMVAFYYLPQELRPLVGIEGGERKMVEKGRFASIRPTGDILKGLPCEIGQWCTRVVRAEPVQGRSRIAATWHDAAGQDTGEPAIVLSENCVLMTHVLRSDDPSNTHGMLLAMLGHCAPELWREGASSALRTIGRFGPYPGTAETMRAMRRAVRRNPVAREAFRRSTLLHREAEQLVEEGEFPAAVGRANEVRTHLVRAYCAVQKPKTPERRLFWCHDAFGVPGMSWDEAVRTLAENGFTGILPNSLWTGVAYYESDVLPVAEEVREKGDQVAECLAACRKYGLECHVWQVCWRLRRQQKSFVERMNEEGRTQVRADGKTRSDWLCPSHPANQELVADAMLEVARKYDVDGVHFDYIRYPGHDTCFCAGCRERFEKRLGRTVEGWPRNLTRDPELKGAWNDFRRDNITAVVRTVSEHVRKTKPNLEVSAAVFSNWLRDRDTVAQDWSLWCKEGYLDFVCPMDYTSRNVELRRMVIKQLQWASPVSCYPGIRVRGICGLIDQITSTRKLGTGGFTLFDYKAPVARDILPLAGLGITRRGR